jgi:membrane-bound lytic murein transglycosylase B
MNFRRITALAFILSLGCVPVHAQEQSFAAFEAALWPDAQANGIRRATFDLALKGVTPDPRVIAATKRQPEYGKPVGAYVNDIASRGRIANGQRKAKEWAKTFDAVEKKFGIERWGSCAIATPTSATNCWSPCASCRTVISRAEKW